MRPEIWLARLDDLQWNSAQSKDYGRWLSAEEKARQHSYRHLKAQQQFTLSRALLRGRLGQLTGMAPDALRFTTATSGKPLLAHTPELHFSLSHSGMWVGLAINHSAPVGFDLEHPSRTRDYLKIARHYFHSEECALLVSTPQKAIKVQFYRLWTLKEAFFKARGTGIYEGLGRINFAQFDQLGSVQLDPGLGAVDSWNFCHFFDPMGSEDGLHLALASQDPEIGSTTIKRGLPDAI
ncbi:MAG: 4'-phosphopantetheinyl transferase superfamily protein [Gammaproteobacteria bacterium]|nr:4'-phosphopantetheinyl transferase superfamily protein [Gammaproteobacteria bacterium]